MQTDLKTEMQNVSDNQGGNSSTMTRFYVGIKKDMRRKRKRPHMI